MPRKQEGKIQIWGGCFSAVDSAATATFRPCTSHINRFKMNMNTLPTFSVVCIIRFDSPKNITLQWFTCIAATLFFFFWFCHIEIQICEINKWLGMWKKTELSQLCCNVIVCNIQNKHVFNQSKFLIVQMITKKKKKKKTVVCCAKWFVFWTYRETSECL